MSATSRNPNATTGNANKRAGYRKNFRARKSESDPRVGRPTTATNDEQQNVDRNYAVINSETQTRAPRTQTRATKTRKRASARPRAHTAGIGRCGVLHRWLGIFVFSGWHRPAFTRLHAPPGCIMHVCGSRREFKPTTSDLSSHRPPFSLRSLRPSIPITPVSTNRRVPVRILDTLYFPRRTRSVSGHLRNGRPTRSLAERAIGVSAVRMPTNAQRTFGFWPDFVDPRYIASTVNYSLNYYYYNLRIIA